MSVSKKEMLDWLKGIEHDWDPEDVDEDMYQAIRALIEEAEETEKAKQTYHELTEQAQQILLRKNPTVSRGFVVNSARAMGVAPDALAMCLEEAGVRIVADIPIYNEEGHSNEEDYMSKAKTAIDGMMNSDIVLYEKILDTPGFAFHFNELVKIALIEHGKEQPTEGYGLEYQIDALIQYARNGISHLDIEQQGRYFNRIDRFGGEIKKAIMGAEIFCEADIENILALIDKPTGNVERDNGWRIGVDFILRKLGIRLWDNYNYDNINPAAVQKLWLLAGRKVDTTAKEGK